MGINGRKLLMNKYTVTHSYQIIMNHYLKMYARDTRQS